MTHLENQDVHYDHSRQQFGVLCSQTVVLPVPPLFLFDFGNQQKSMLHLPIKTETGRN
jgi:hypothetical protein